MKNIILLAVSFMLASCKIWKEKERVVKDSVNLYQQWQEEDLKQVTASKSELLWETAQDNSFTIIADAPFIWQPDSGLKAQAGHFQIYTKEKSAGLKKESHQQNSYRSSKKKEVEKAVQKLKQRDKKVKTQSKPMLLLWIMGGLLVSLFIYRFRAKRRITLFAS